MPVWIVCRFFTDVRFRRQLLYGNSAIYVLEVLSVNGLMRFWDTFLKIILSIFCPFDNHAAIYISLPSCKNRISSLFLLSSVLPQTLWPCGNLICTMGDVNIIFLCFDTMHVLTVFTLKKIMLWHITVLYSITVACALMHNKDIQRWSYTKVYNSNTCACFDMAHEGDAFCYIFLCFEL